MNQQAATLRGQLRHQEPMSRHTSWKVGGPARDFYHPADSRDLSVFLGMLDEREPLEWVGLGSNLLVRDGGFNGTVIHTLGCLNRISQIGENRLFIEAGVSCAVAARFASRRGLVGLEFFAGIPGTVGGALKMNAGAFGGETWDFVESVEMIDREGHVVERKPEDFDIAYREVGTGDGEWFLSAVFSLVAGDTEEARLRIRDLLDKRSSSQPTRQASGGSTFRNPEGDHAARLIESSGLKGLCIGGACVSEKHANFIINTGTATAADIEALIEKVQEIVRDKTGVLLQREVHIIGEALN